MAKQTQQPDHEPELEDPLNLPERYADEVAAFEFRNGIFVITFAAVRSITLRKRVKETAVHRRVVTDRLIITPAAAIELRQLLQAAISEVKMPEVGTDKPH